MLKGSRYIQWILGSIIAVFSLLVFLPLVLFGTESVIQVHDFLDQHAAWYKMFKESDLFFVLDSPTRGFSGMSTLHYSFVNNSFQSLMYYAFPVYTAFLLNYILSTIVSVLSMFYLLRKIVNSVMKDIPQVLILSCAVLYSLLPHIPDWTWGLATLPILVSSFLYFIQKDSYRLDWRVLGLFFLPFFSHSTSIGIFALGLWLLGFLVDWVRNKRPRIALVVGWILLFSGYFLVDLKLFYSVVIESIQLNRSIFPSYLEWFSSLKILVVRTGKYFFKGAYHATTHQTVIILAVVLLTFISIRYILRGKQKSDRIVDSFISSKKRLETYQAFLIVLSLTFTAFLFSFIGGLHDSRILSNFFANYLPFLSGFNWGRIWVANRLIWYIVFTLSVSILYFWGSSDNEYLSNVFGRKFRLVLRVLSLSLVGLQMSIIVLYPVTYNHSVRTLLNEIFIKPGFLTSIPKIDSDSLISYREFYDTELFHEIKTSIGYNNEWVVAFGFHPSVLMYNGFSCIDGYNNAYPLDYMKRFRKIIEPELTKNPAAQDYFDSWGGRMYLYSSELDFIPTREQSRLPVSLNVNASEMINNFKCKYVLSRAPIQNTIELGLILKEHYTHDDSIYEIWVYSL